MNFVDVKFKITNEIAHNILSNKKMQYITSKN